MREDLQAIVDLLRSQTKARVVVTVSPIPLHATVTAADVRVANSESKHRIRAAVSEFIQDHPDVKYFHSYEMVTTAERMSDFMLADGRHVSRTGVDYIVSEFVRMFGGGGLTAPDVDLSWLTEPSKVARHAVPPTPGHQILPDAYWRTRGLVRRLAKRVLKW
jgi:hypothetical protein